VDAPGQSSSSLCFLAQHLFVATMSSVQCRASAKLRSLSRFCRLLDPHDYKYKFQSFWISWPQSLAHRQQPEFWREIEWSSSWSTANNNKKDWAIIGAWLWQFGKCQGSWARFLSGPIVLKLIALALGACNIGVQIQKKVSDAECVQRVEEL
jgi:hypothetical protein